MEISCKLKKIWMAFAKDYTVWVLAVENHNVINDAAVS